MTTATTTAEISAPARYSYVDLTEELERAIKDSGVTDGVAVAFCAHTTAVLLLNEWEDGALEDFRARMLHLVPEDVYYAHDDLTRRTQNLEESHERRNGQAHVKAMLLSASSHAIPVSGGVPMLGRWQRLILFEMDDPKARQIVFHVTGE
ncbi:MAG TPA: secondary thiamine-phosphate synthase enzyme YjbQ [Actinomycetota bacterium]|jgi:secondary thiamine-phosphate synthase enzyme